MALPRSSAIEEKVVPNTLNPFPFAQSQSESYYMMDKDQVRVLFKGANLLKDYYHLKYSTNIKCVSDESNSGSFMEIDEFLKQYSLKSDRKMEAKEDFRCTYILQSPGQSHKVSLSYVREKEEGLLFVDTLGIGDPATLSALDKFGKKNKIPVYINETHYQKDHNSCGSMSVILGRDITQKNKEGYKFELLPYLKAHAREENGLRYTDLPLFLAKLSQHPKRLDDSMSDPAKINVHDGKEETLAEFRPRYQKEIMTSSQKKINADTFVLSKGVKYKKLIIRLFFLEQVKASFLEATGMELSKKSQLEFVKLVKNFGIDNPSIYQKPNDALLNGINQFINITTQNKAEHGVKIKIKKPGGLRGFFSKTAPLDVSSDNNLLNDLNSPSTANIFSSLSADSPSGLTSPLSGVNSANDAVNPLSPLAVFESAGPNAFAFFSPSTSASSTNGGNFQSIGSPTSSSKSVENDPISPVGNSSSISATGDRGGPAADTPRTASRLDNTANDNFISVPSVITRPRSA